MEEVPYDWMMMIEVEGHSDDEEEEGRSHYWVKIGELREREKWNRWAFSLLQERVLSQFQQMRSGVGDAIRGVPYLSQNVFDEIDQSQANVLSFFLEYKNVLSGEENMEKTSHLSEREESIMDNTKDPSLDNQSLSSLGFDNANGLDTREPSPSGLLEKDNNVDRKPPSSNKLFEKISAPILEKMKTFDKKTPSKIGSLDKINDEKIEKTSSGLFGRIKTHDRGASLKNATLEKQKTTSTTENPPIGKEENKFEPIHKSPENVASEKEINSTSINPSLGNLESQKEKTEVLNTIPHLEANMGRKEIISSSNTSDSSTVNAARKTDIHSTSINPSLGHLESEKEITEKLNTNPPVEANMGKKEISPSSNTNDSTSLSAENVARKKETPSTSINPSPGNLENEITEELPIEKKENSKSKEEGKNSTTIVNHEESPTKEPKVYKFLERCCFG